MNRRPRRFYFRSVSTAIELFEVVLICLCASFMCAEPVSVRHKEGLLHGFLVLRDQQGRAIATGDLIQTTEGSRVTTELVFRFKDGSVHDETTVFSQDNFLRLASDHLIQRGPSFPASVDSTIDATQHKITVRSVEKGKEKDTDQGLDMPDDLSNGMTMTILRNLSAETPETKVSWLTTSASPRLVKLVISPDGERQFRAGGTLRKAIDFRLQFEIGGIAGAIAPLVGKKPPDAHMWISAGPAPTFIRFEGPLYEGGPVWRIELASVAIPGQSATTQHRSP
jgi:hypothetical protein